MYLQDRALSVGVDLQATAGIAVIAVGCDIVSGRDVADTLHALSFVASLCHDRPLTGAIGQPPVARSRVLDPAAAVLGGCGGEWYQCDQRADRNRAKSFHAFSPVCGDY